MSIKAKTSGSPLKPQDHLISNMFVEGLYTHRFISCYTNADFIDSIYGHGRLNFDHIRLKEIIIIIEIRQLHIQFPGEQSYYS